MPADAVSPVSERIFSRIQPRDLGRGGDVLEILGHIEIGLVERERFDDGRVLRKYRADLQRDFSVHLEPRLHEDQVRTFPSGSH